MPIENLLIYYFITIRDEDTFFQLFVSGIGLEELELLKAEICTGLDIKPITRARSWVLINQID